MKIIQINAVHGTDSTGRVIADLHRQLLSDGHDALIYYGRKKNSTSIKDKRIHKCGNEAEAHLTALFTRINGLQYTGAPLSTSRLIHAIDREKPDLVHLHCINGYFVNIYRLLAHLKETGCPVVLTLHAEFMHTGSCVHAYGCNKWLTGCGKCPQRWSATKSWFFDRTKTAWKRMKKSLNSFTNLHVVSVSRWLNDRACRSPIMDGASLQVIHNGMDTSRIFRPHHASCLRKRFNIPPNHNLLLHVTTAFDDKPGDLKGGEYVIQLAEMLQDKLVTIVVIGKDFVTAKTPQNLMRLGRLNNTRELTEWYSEADLTIICSKGETFSMVTAESLCCGTPVAGFRAGGPESIAPAEFASFVTYGDIEALKDAVENRLGNGFSQPSRDDISAWARRAFDRKTMCDAYFNVYERAIHKRKMMDESARCT